MGFRIRNDYADSLDSVVVALCRDFGRRSVGSRVRRVDMEYKYLNTRMLEAVTDVVGDVKALTLIEEIGSRIGYANSTADEVSETAYKRLKQEVKLSIAKKLYLID